MEGQWRTNPQLLAELAELRQRVSQLEQTEKSLREREERYHTLVDVVPQLMGWTDANREIIECNRRWYEYTGQTAEEARGFGWLRALHPDDVGWVRQRIEEGRVDGKPYEAEYRVRKASDGSYRWHLARSVPMKDKNGKITGSFGYITDIDDQKRAEETLRESEERFRKIFEEGPIGVLLVGADGRIQHCNRRFCEMLGYAEDEIVSLGLAGISHPDDWKVDCPLVLRLCRGEIRSYDVEKRYLRKDGQVILGHLMVSLVCDEAGRPINSIGMVEDIAERKRAEERVRAAERTLRALIDANPESLVLLDAEGTILIANETAACRLGRTMDEVTGQTVFDLLPADLAPQRYRRVAEVIRTGKPVRFQDKRLEWHYENAIYPVLDEKGNVAAVAILGIDQTDRIQTEEALRKARDELEQRVEERTAALVAANESLRESRDEFQMIFDEMVEGCLITDIETKRFLRTNASMCQMLGYSEEELLAASFQDIHPVAAVTNDLQRFQAIAEGRRSINENRPVVRKDGSVFYADITGRRVVYDGRPCVLAMFRDVTERRQAQVALRESEEKYKTLVETLPHAVIMADLTGHVTFASRRLSELYGSESVDEFLGKTPLDYLGPEDCQKFHSYYQKTLEDGITRNVEYAFRRSDGTLFPAEVSAAVVRDTSEKPVAVIAVLRDITERKRAEQTLRQSHEELQAIYDSVVDGIIVADAEMVNPVRANAAYSRMVGYSEDEVYGLSPGRLHTPEVLEKVWEHLEAVKQGAVARMDDVAFLRKDGSVIYLDVITRPISYKERPCWISFFHDVTERKKAQEALRREYRTLRHLLQSSDHERQVIAYEIHDGLAQYLAAAIMQFEVYRHAKETKPKDASKAYDAGMTMLRQAHFDARRLISGVRPPILDESGVVAAIVHLVNEERRQKGPKIEFHDEVAFDRLTPIVENAIYRIVQEGLRNAWQHSKSEKVRVSLVQHDNDLRITIQDWGVGFNPGEIETECFGLEGIRERARLLGGTTSVESTPGRGTCITIELPLVLRE